MAVLLYGWNLEGVESPVQKLTTSFSNNCVRRILNTHWPEIITDEDVGQTDLEEIGLQVKWKNMSGWNIH